MPPTPVCPPCTLSSRWWHQCRSCKSSAMCILLPILSWRPMSIRPPKMCQFSWQELHLAQVKDCENFSSTSTICGLGEQFSRLPAPGRIPCNLNRNTGTFCVDMPQANIASDKDSSCVPVMLRSSEPGFLNNLVHVCGCTILRLAWPPQTHLKSKPGI